MKRIDDIDRYLRAHFAAQRMPGPTPVEPRVYPFVTISRQTGTGGHALADTMLEVFSEQADVRFAGSLDSLIEEEYRSRTNDFFHQMLRSTAHQDMVMNRAFLVVRAIAGMGKSIIVGRGGSHVTKDMPQGVSLRIVAPEDVRIARAMEVHGLTEKEARAGASKRDSDRARLLRSFFGADIGDPTGYDVTWNADSASFSEISQATASLVRCRGNGSWSES
jgi:cytidylate kinase